MDFIFYWKSHSVLICVFESPDPARPWEIESLVNLHFLFISLKNLRCLLVRKSQINPQMKPPNPTNTEIKINFWKAISSFAITKAIKISKKFSKYNQMWSNITEYLWMCLKHNKKNKRKNDILKLIILKIKVGNLKSISLSSVLQTIQMLVTNIAHVIKKQIGGRRKGSIPNCSILAKTFVLEWRRNWRHDVLNFKFVKYYESLQKANKKQARKYFKIWHQTVLFWILHS